MYSNCLVGNRISWIALVIFSFLQRAEQACSTQSAATPLVAGFEHTLILQNDGSVRALGRNNNGQLGDGTTQNRLSWMVVANGVAAIAARREHTVILKNDGSVWTVGRNAHGQLGDSTQHSKNSFVQVWQSTDEGRAIASGWEHSVILSGNGQVLTTGRNNRGQLGRGQHNTDKYDFATAWTVTDGVVSSIGAGSEHTVIVKSDGEVWAVGYNHVGQLGDGTKVDKSTFVRVIQNGGVATDAGVEHTVILKNDGSVWTAGLNKHGELGDGTKNNKLVFVQVVATGVSAISAADWYTMILQHDGSVRTVGRNNCGQLGDGTKNDRQSWTVVAYGVSAIKAGWEYSIVLKNDGSVHAVGRNNYGQLGDGTQSDSTAYVQVIGHGAGQVGHFIIEQAHSGCFNQSTYAAFDWMSDNTCEKQPCAHFSTTDPYAAWCRKMACANTERDAWCVNGSGGDTACADVCSSCTPTQKQCLCAEASTTVEPTTTTEVVTTTTEASTTAVESTTTTEVMTTITEASTTAVESTTTTEVMTTITEATTATTMAIVTTTSMTTTIVSTTRMTSTSTSMPAVLLRGEMSLTVTQAQDFVEEENLAGELQQVIATLIEVPVSWVYNVSVELETGRSLLQVAGRSLVESSSADNVRVTWSIRVPPHSPNNITAIVVLNKVDSIEIAKVTQKIMALVQAGVFGNPYEVSVNWWFVMPEENHDPEADYAAAAGDKSNDIVIWAIISAVVAFSFVSLCCIVRKACKLLRRPKKFHVATSRDEFLRLGGRFAHRDFVELLHPPDSISASDASQIRRLARAMLDYDDKDVQVFLSYALGHRHQDESGCGPGLYYAAAVLMVLYENGIKCLCDLMFPDDAPQEIITAKLSSSSGKCETLLVLQTRALYESQDSLKEIYTAQNLNLQIIPLRCENDLPSKNEQWPSICSNDLDNIVRVADVQAKFDSFNSIPSPPYTIAEKPTVLNELCVDLKLKLRWPSPESELVLDVPSSKSIVSTRSSSADSIPKISGSQSLLISFDAEGRQPSVPTYISESMPLRLDSDYRQPSSKSKVSLQSSSADSSPKISGSQIQLSPTCGSQSLPLGLDSAYVQTSGSHRGKKIGKGLQSMRAPSLSYGLASEERATLSPKHKRSPKSHRGTSRQERIERKSKACRGEDCAQASSRERQISQRPTQRRFTTTDEAATSIQAAYRGKRERDAMNQVKKDQAEKVSFSEHVRREHKSRSTRRGEEVIATSSGHTQREHKSRSARRGEEVNATSSGHTHREHKSRIPRGEDEVIASRSLKPSRQSSKRQARKDEVRSSEIGKSRSIGGWTNRSREARSLV